MSFQADAFQNDAFQMPQPAPQAQVLIYGGGAPLHVPLWPRDRREREDPIEIDGEGDAALSEIVVYAHGIVTRPSLRQLRDEAIVRLVGALDDGDDGLDADDALTEAITFYNAANRRMKEGDE